MVSLKNNTSRCPECGSDTVVVIGNKHHCQNCNHDFSPTRIFISYGRDEHTPLAEKLKVDLQEKGFMVWFDKDKLKDGFDWETYIEDGLSKLAEDRENSFMLFLMTPHSVRKPDGYCLNEITMAILKNITIIPIMVVSSEPPLSICRIQWLDMQDCIPLDIKNQTYQKKFEQLLNGLKTKSFEFEGGQKTLLKQLEPIDFSDIITKHAVKFTGREWLIDRVDRWFNDPNPLSKIFWITGAPGIGKSAIASWLCVKKREVSAIHFCVFGNEEKTDVIKIIKSIAYQISTQLPDYAYQLQLLDIREILKTYFQPGTLFDKLIILPISKISPPDCLVTILIDALDEATINDRNELALLIAAEFEKTPSWLRLIITSRPDAEVMVPLQKFSPYKIDASCSENLNDIRSYLRVKLLPYLTKDEMGSGDKLSELEISTDSIEKIEYSRWEEAVEKIAQKSEGIFLYANCIIDELKLGRLKISDLESFPSSLAAVYFMFFEREFHDLENYRKNIRDAIGIVISCYEPISTGLLQSVMGWKQTELNDFMCVLGSLFTVNLKNQEETINVYHLSLIEWLTDKEKSGPYYISLSDGREKLADFSKSEYAKYLDDKGYFLHPYTVKWLPLLLADTEHYSRMLELLIDNRYRELMIRCGFVDNLFSAMKKLLLLSKELSNKEDYIRIQKGIILAHYENNSINLELIKELLINFEEEHLTELYGLISFFEGQNRLTLYLIVLYTLIIQRRVDLIFKKGEAIKLLGEVEKVSVQNNNLNCIEILPLSFIVYLCCELEKLEVSCDVLTSITKVNEYCCDDKFYCEEIQGLQKRIFSDENNNANPVLSQLILAKVSCELNKKNNSDCALIIANRLPEELKDYCLTSISELPKQNQPNDNKCFTKKPVIKLFLISAYLLLAEPIVFSVIWVTRFFTWAITKFPRIHEPFIIFFLFLLIPFLIIEELIKKKFQKKSFFGDIVDVLSKRKQFCLLINKFLIRNVLDRQFNFLWRLNGFNPAKLRWLHFPKSLIPLLRSRINRICSNVNLVIRNGNKCDDSKRKAISKILLSIGRLPLEHDRELIIVEIAEYFRKNNFDLWSRYMVSEYFQMIQKTESLEKARMKNWRLISKIFESSIGDILGIESLISIIKQKNKFDDKFIKIRAVGDIAFLSDDKDRMNIIQRKVFESIDDDLWKRQITGVSKQRYSWIIYDWSLVFPEICGMYNLGGDEWFNPEIEIFAENSNKVSSATPAFYFPKLIGMVDIDVKPKYNLEIPNVDDFVYNILYYSLHRDIESQILKFRNPENSEIKIVSVIGSIAVLDLYYEKLKLGSSEEATAYFQIVKQYINGYEGAFIDFFRDLYINKNIDAVLKSAINTDGLSDTYLEYRIIIVAQYLIGNSQYDLLDIFIDALLKNDRHKSIYTMTGYLLVKNFSQIVIRILDKVNDASLKNSINGYLALQSALDGHFDVSKEFLRKIDDNALLDFYLVKIATIAAQLDADVNELFELTTYLNTRANIYWLVSEVLYAKGEIQAAGKWRHSAVESAKKLKSDVESKKNIIRWAIIRSIEFDYEMALNGFEYLKDEKLVDNVEIRMIFQLLYFQLVKSNRASIAYQIFRKHPDSVDQFISSMKTLPVKTIVEDIAPFINETYILSAILGKSICLMFRDRKYIDNYLYDATSLAIKDVNMLYNILYRYTAYVAFCDSSQNKTKLKILAEANELIDVEDWIAEIAD